MPRVIEHTLPQFQEKFEVTATGATDLQDPETGQTLFKDKMILYATRMTDADPSANLEQRFMLTCKLCKTCLTCEQYAARSTLTVQVHYVGWWNRSDLEAAGSKGLLKQLGCDARPWTMNFESVRAALDQ